MDALPTTTMKARSHILFFCLDEKPDFFIFTFISVSGSVLSVNMTDIILPQKQSGTSSAREKGLFLRRQELRRAIELLFFAYRDFTYEADELLSDLDLGRAHHRVIYFVGRQPGITVSDLLAILHITKQSLSRVLSHLIDEDYIIQETGPRDRRQRLLHLTDKGVSLEKKLTDLQCNRFARAYSERGIDAVDGFQQILTSLLDDDTRSHLRAVHPDRID